MNISKNKKAVIKAHEMGYRIISNVIFNPKGKPVKGNVNISTSKGTKSYYHSFSIKDAQKTATVRVHQLVAYQNFGNDFLQEGIHIRHLDGNSLNNNPDNIVLGTPHENAMDRSPEARRESAIIASKHIHKFKNKDALKEFLTDRVNGMSYRELGIKWRLNKSTLSCLFNQAEYIETAAQEFGIDIDMLRTPMLSLTFKSAILNNFLADKCSTRT